MKQLLNYENRNHVERFETENLMERMQERKGDKYLEYRNKWEAAEKGKYISPSPLHIELGLTSWCNLRCKMCFRSADNVDISKNYMSLDVAKKIAEQCEKLEIPAIALGEGSEGLLHPNIIKLMEIYSDINFMDYFVMTNGLLLNDEISYKLLECNVDRLNISIDAATKETYKKIRGANLDILEEKIDRFLEIRGNNKYPLLRVSFVKQADNINEINMFIDKWGAKADIIDFQDMVDYGNVDNLLSIEEDIDYICPLPFTKLCIRWNGDMYPCTNPYQKYFRIGNINDMSIEEAWNGKIMQDLRKAMIEKKMPLPCKNCRGTRFYSDRFLK